MNKDNRLQQILDIGIALSTEKNIDILLYYIVDTAMNLTGSDGGTLYIVKDNTLSFKIMKTRSKNIDIGKNGEEIDIPPVPIKKENICAYSALTKKSLNIDDVYNSELFDFSGPKKYDEMNNYHTESMVAIPMVNHEDEVLGVMQLINAQDEDGNIRPYTIEEEKILNSLASQTAIAISNVSYIEEINKQIWSFTSALTEAIDARTPYNGSHTRKVAEYSALIIDRINNLYKEDKEDIYFDDDHKNQIIMAAYLHDIGKMIIPIEVMNKENRLGEKTNQIELRLENIGLRLKLDKEHGIISANELDEELLKVNKALEIIKTVNSIGFINDELYNEIDMITKYKYENKQENVYIPYFNDDEIECLKIRKGTLTDNERSIMESHVIMTERILSKVYFNAKYKDAPKWAAQHHECINGSGYPNKIQGDQLGIEARILAVADICDALLATDRPYKKPMPKDKAFAILYSMADEGKIEKKLVDYLNESLI